MAQSLSELKEVLVRAMAINQQETKPKSNFSVGDKVKMRDGKDAFIAKIDNGVIAHLIREDGVQGGGSVLSLNGKKYECWVENVDDLTLIKKVEVKPKIEIKYKPGTSIISFVKEILGKLKDSDDKDRVKWLNVFDRCVLPEEVRSQIDDAVTNVLMRHKFEEWGINETFEKGLTNSIMIYGPHGTGKTMIAEAIAAVLDMNMIKVSSGDIQSNKPGETERNIQHAFEEAKRTNSVLLFDECDSVLGDRNFVGTIMAAEINALLTEIERFDGVAIFTTNRIHVLDPALERRIISKVKLGNPTKEARLMIWKNLIPSKMPVKDLDYDLLAEAELAGGDIKNCILMAARRAISKNMDFVTMDTFIDVIKSTLTSKKEFRESKPKEIVQLGKGISRIMKEMM